MKFSYWVVDDKPFPQLIVIGHSRIIVANIPKKRLEQVKADLNHNQLPERLYGRPIKSIEYVDQFQDSPKIRIKLDSGEELLNFADRQGENFVQDLCAILKKSYTKTLTLNHTRREVFQFIKKVILIIIIFYSLFWVANSASSTSTSPFISSLYYNFIRHLGSRGMYIIACAAIGFITYKFILNLTLYSKIIRTRFKK